MQRGVAYKKLNQQVSIKRNMLCMGKNQQTKEWTDYLSNKRQKFDVILMICACSFGLRPLLEVILYRLLSFGGTPAVRCPE